MSDCINPACKEKDLHPVTVRDYDGCCGPLCEEVMDHNKTCDILAELEAEQVRLRELLALKVGSAIRIELPSEANGMKCHITSKHEADEERLAGILSEALKMFCDVIYEVKQ